MTNEEIARFFNETRPFIQGKQDLRDPQVERRHCSPPSRGITQGNRLITSDARRTSVVEWRSSGKVV